MPAQPAHLSDRPRTTRVTRVALLALFFGLVLSACVPIPIRLPHPGPVDRGCPQGVALWSDPASWPGGVPAAGSEPVIPNGTTIHLDVNSAPLGGLTVDGTLEFCRDDLELRSDWILVHGTLRAGTATDPFVDQLTITLTGADTNESIMGMGTRGLLVMGGRLELHGNAPAVSWTRIDAHAAAGSSALRLASPVDWVVGDEVAVTITDWYGSAQTERRTITAITAGINVTLHAPLTASRWGLRQYVTPSGMSLSPANTVVPTANPTPTVLDERAEVANLTRNIRIQGPDDALWQTQGFGAHLMVMDLASAVVVDGVEFRRVGQRGRLGRYPIHWHRLSYGADGSMLGDATGQVIRSSTIVGSTNRCITLHATNGVLVQDNVCLDIRGHGVFLEDAVERRNVIEGNLVAQVRNPPPGSVLKLHEATSAEGSSGMWLSNPDNTVRNNVVSDAQGFGFWLAFPQRPFGLSANVVMRPDRLLFGVFDNNTAHSNRRQGVMFDEVETDELGNTFPRQYFSTTDGQDIQWPYPTLRRFSIRGLTVYKNQLGGFWNRVTVPDYTEFVSADNEDRFFAGSGADGLITRSLVVGTSLNSATPRPNPSLTPTAFATYHSAFDIRENIVVNFPLVPGSRSGMFATNDYYVRAVDKGQVRNPGNLMINSAPGYRVPRPSPDYALAGALWDPHGTWGPAGRYNVYDDPFLTHNATCSGLVPAGSNAVSCTGPYYGIRHFVLDRVNARSMALMPVNVTRYDALGAVVGTWNVGDGTLIASAFGNMRHFAAHRGGRYLIDFPASALPRDVGLSIENLLTADDQAVIGIRFSGAEPAQVFTSTYYNYLNLGYENTPASATKRDYAPVANLAAVTASAGDTYWQDVANNVVWVKARGGLTQFFNDADYGATSDELLYRATYLRIV